MPDIATSIGKRLRECRTAKGISQEELAHRAGMHSAHVGQIERGVKCPTMNSLNNLLKGLNISFSYFFNFEMIPDIPERSKELEKIDSILVTLSPKELDAVHTVLKSIVKGFKNVSQK